MNNQDNGTDRNISLVAGWNLIGYSGGNNISIENLTFTNSSGSSFAWANAVANNKLQAYLAYYDSSAATASQRKYKYVATSDLGMDDTKLVPEVGYWLYANQSGNLTLPGVGGTLANQQYLISKLRFSNGTIEANLTQAGNSTNNWVLYNSMYFVASNGDYNLLRTNPNINLGQKNNISSMEGMFIYSNRDNIDLIRQN